MNTRHLIISSGFGLGLVAALLWVLNAPPLHTTHAVASQSCSMQTGNVITVCLPSTGTCDHTNVQAAVDAAAEGDVIKVAAGTYTGVSSRAGATQTVYISKTVTIRGGYTTANGFAGPPDPAANPTTLDAQQQGRVFYIATPSTSPGQVISPTIEGLRIGGGDADSGGGVYIVSATVTLSRSVIQSNTASMVGGGLYLRTGELTLIGNVILSNTAGASGGGVFMWASSATIESNVIAGNVASGEGALWAGGGGVYLHESDARLVNNAVIDNWVANQGGGLYINGSSARLLHTTIARNGCTAAIGGRGSGVYMRQDFSPGYAALTNTILTNHGTGLYAAEGTTARIDGVLWYDNTTANTDGNGAITITNAITGTPAFVAEGAHPYHLAVGSAAIDQGVSAGVTSDIDGDTRPMDGDADGAATADLGADEYWPCRARLNDAPTDYLTVQAAVDASTHPTDVVKVGGYCVGVEAHAGATQTVYISKTLTILGGYATHDFSIPRDPVANPTTLDAQQQGRVFYVAEDANPTIEGLHITGGNATGAGGSVADFGGGVCVFSATATISNSSISNSVARHGGGLYLGRSKVTLIDNTVASNTGSWVGGGLYAGDSEVTIEGNAILSNTAETMGGGMLLWSSDATIAGNIIAHNRAFAGTSYSSGGGGVYLEDGCAATLINNIIAENEVDVQGSGVYVDGSVAHMLHNTIVHNTTRNVTGEGTGVYINVGLSPTVVVMTNTILVNHGTGVYAEAGTSVWLDGMLWYENTIANTDGGGGITVTYAITGTPAFVSDVAHPYHLGPGSVAIDAGVSTGVTSDIDGDPRPIHLLPDLGADEAPLWLFLPAVFRESGG